MQGFIFKNVLPTHTFCGKLFDNALQSKQKTNPREWEIQNPRNNKNNSEEKKENQRCMVALQRNGNKFRSGSQKTSFKKRTDPI